MEATEEPAPADVPAVAPEAPLEEDPTPANDTRLLQNDEESFALAPVDASAVRVGWPRAKRKRKLIVDEVKNISGEEMKAQLSDTTDIVTTLDLAPPTKRLMHWKETGGVEKLFALPGRPIHARSLAKLYQKHLTSEPVQNEDFGMAGDSELDNMNLDVVRDEADESAMPAPKPRGRPPKRKLADADDDAAPEPAAPERPTRATRAAAAAQQEPEEPPAPVDPSAAFDALVPQQMPEEPPQEPSLSEPPMDDISALDSVAPPSVAPPSVAPPSVAPPSVAPATPQHDPPQQDAPLDEHAPAMSPQPMSPDHVAQPPSPSHQEDAQDDEPEEEQADDETYEQFEERVVNKRAGLMFHQIKKKLRNKPMAFSSLTHGNNRKQVAQKFYTMLVLKKLQAVELYQEGPFAEMTISRGNLFENASL